MLYKKYAKGSKKLTPVKYQGGIQKVTMPPGAEAQNGLTGFGGTVDKFTGQPYGAMGDGLGMIAKEAIGDNKTGSNRDAAASQIQTGLNAAGTTASVALNPAVLAATGGLSALAVPVAFGVGALASGPAAQSAERQQKFAENANAYADTQNKLIGREAGYVEPSTQNTFGRTLYGDMAPKEIFAKNGVRMGGYSKYNDGIHQLSADFSGPSHAQGGIKYIAPVPSQSGIVNKPVEVEGGELELTSMVSGEKTIIPKNKAGKARKFLEQGNDLALETLIDTLPREQEATQAPMMMAHGGKMRQKYANGVQFMTADPFEGLPQRGTITLEGVVDENGNPIVFETIGGQVVPNFDNYDYYRQYLQDVQGLSGEEADAQLEQLSSLAADADQQYRQAGKAAFDAQKAQVAAQGGGAFLDQFGNTIQVDPYGNQIIDGVAYQEIPTEDGGTTLLPVSTPENPSLAGDPTQRFSEFERGFGSPNLSRFINEMGPDVLAAADEGEGFGALQRMFDEYNASLPEGEQLSPDEFSDFFDSFYTPDADFGAGITGTRGFGSGDTRNLQDMNLDAMRQYLGDRGAASAQRQALMSDFAGQGAPAAQAQPLPTPAPVDAQGAAPTQAQGILPQQQGQGANVGEIAALAGSALPTVYNLSQGLFGDSKVYQPDYVDLDRLQYTDMSDPQRQRVRGSVNLAQEQTRNYAFNAANQGQNAMMAKIQGDRLLNEIDLGEIGRYDQVQRGNVDIANREQMINLGQMEKAQRMTDLAERNKQEYLEAGIGGVATLSDDLYTRGLGKSRDQKADVIQGNVLDTMKDTFPFLYGDDGGIDQGKVDILKQLLGTV